MDDNSRRIVLLYEYLLSKDVYLKQSCVNKEEALLRKQKYADDIFEYYMSLVKYEIFKEFSREVWNLIQ